jgi:hypothetical protein
MEAKVAAAGRSMEAVLSEATAMLSGLTARPASCSPPSRTCASSTSSSCGSIPTAR